MKRLPFIAIAAMLLALGCKEKEPVTPDRGRTLLHILGAMEVDSFRVTLDYYNADDIVIDNFFHHRNFPLQGYADLEAGGTPDEFGNGKLYVSLSLQPFANIAPDTIMAPRAIELIRDARSTLCFVDSFGVGTFIKIDDAPGTADATSAQVRFVNLSSPLTAATLTTTNSAVNISSVAFMDDSPFTSMPSGTYDFEVRDGSGAVVQTVTYTVSPFTTYTFYVSGSTASELKYFIH